MGHGVSSESTVEFPGEKEGCEQEKGEKASYGDTVAVHGVRGIRDSQCYRAQGKQQGDGQKNPNKKYFRTCTTHDSCNRRISKASTNPGKFIKESTVPGHIWNYDTPHPFLCQNPPSLSYLKKLFIIELRVYIFLMLPYRVSAAGYI